MQFLRTILIIFLVYYCLKLIGRLIAPFLIKKMANKMQDRFNRKFMNHQNTCQEAEEGTITIQNSKAKNKSNSKDIGDYIDFEEIEE
tara:strand:- start:423 stop:683 length:261 start_codon:yes stop_codon:yes gene_type:complete